MIGNMIGNYKIVERIGEGGMGQVFRAVDTMLEREVAIKSLHRHLTQDASRLERFRSEAITLAKLNHPNIAALYNFFEQQGDYFMVMEYVDGETFESLLRRLGALPLRQALELFCQVLHGFEHAHSKQVIHRDIKPSNLMLNSSGEVKITDFGIARVLGTTRLTATGRLLGTLEYMSPEQVQGHEQDERSDIYSLGILLYEMMTGRVPFSSSSDFEIMRAHMEAKPVPPRELTPELPEEVERAIHLALEKNPAARFQRAREFRSMLERATERLPEEGAVITPKLKETRVADAIATAVKEARLAEPAQDSVPPGAATRVADAPLSVVRGLKRSSPKTMIAGGGAVLAVILALVFLLKPPSPGQHAGSGNMDQKEIGKDQGGGGTGGSTIIPPYVPPVRQDLTDDIVQAQESESNTPQHTNPRKRKKESRPARGAVREFPVIHDHSGAIYHAASRANDMASTIGDTVSTVRSLFGKERRNPRNAAPKENRRESRFDYCAGVLRISPQGVEYQTMQSTDGRRDDFMTRSLADIKEVKPTNFLIGGRYTAFHIRLQNRKNYNFAHVDRNQDLGTDSILDMINRLSGQR